MKQLPQPNAVFQDIPTATAATESRYSCDTMLSVTDSETAEPSTCDIAFVKTRLHAARVEGPAKSSSLGGG